MIFFLMSISISLWTVLEGIYTCKLMHISQAENFDSIRAIIVIIIFFIAFKYYFIIYLSRNAQKTGQAHAGQVSFFFFN